MVEYVAIARLPRDDDGSKDTQQVADTDANLGSLHSLCDLKTREFQGLYKSYSDAVQNEVCVLKAEVCEWKHKYDNIRRDFEYNFKLLQDRDTELQNYDTLLVALQQEDTARDNRVGALEAQCLDLTHSLALRTQQLDSQQHEYDVKTSELAGRMAEQQAMHSRDKESHEAQHKLLLDAKEQELHQKVTQLSEAREKIRQLEIHNEEAHKNTAQAALLRNEITDVTSNLNSQVESLQYQLRVARLRIAESSEHQDQLMQARREVEDHKNQLCQSNIVVASLTQQLEEHRETIRQLKQHKDTQTEHTPIEDCVTVVAEASQRISSLETRISTVVDGQNDRLRDMFDTNAETVKAAMSDWRNAIHGIQEKFGDNITNSKLHHEIELKGLAQNLESQIQFGREMDERLHLEIASLTDMVAHKDKTITGLQQKLEETEKTIVGPLKTANEIKSRELISVKQQFTQAQVAAQTARQRFTAVLKHNAQASTA
eukprot:GHVQ01003885.1.p1 GENE.GHVQ01003885.1~~GHVQ01003885.1.p1  ORF type:complete len:486 (+),score=69.60 GHVQ01003885.1:140-1597(+)